MKKDFLIPERFSVLSILLTLVNEFVKLLTLHVLLIWFGHCAGIDSICPSSSSLYHALAPGSWFVWLHKWAFLPSGFWLRPVDGGHCQQMKERKEGEVTHGTSLLPCGISAAWLHLPIEGHSSHQIALFVEASAALFLSSPSFTAHGRCQALLFLVLHPLLSLVISSQPSYAM